MITSNDLLGYYVILFGRYVPDYSLIQINVGVIKKQFGFEIYSVGAHFLLKPILCVLIAIMSLR